MIQSIFSMLLVFALATPAEQPLEMSIYQTIGMAPLTLRIKVKAATEGKEVCIVIDGPNYYRNSCQVLSGITWTQDFELRAGGEYAVFAVSERYRTPETTVRVIGHNEGN